MVLSLLHEGLGFGARGFCFREQKQEPLGTLKFRPRIVSEDGGEVTSNILRMQGALPGTTGNPAYSANNRKNKV